MVANGEPAQEGSGRAEGEGDVVDDESTTSFFSLELPLTAGGHRSSATDDHHEEKDGNSKGIDGPELAAAAAEAVHHRRRERVAAAPEALRTPVGPVARLRALVRKLRWPKKAAAGTGKEQGSGRPTAGAQARSSPAAARRTPAEAALRYLSKMPILMCRRGVVADDDTSPPPPPHLPLQAAAVLPRRNSRGEAELIAARSSVSVAALPPPRDDSRMQAQDGVATAIAYCKLPLSPSRVSSRG